MSDKKVNIAVIGGGGVGRQALSQMFIDKSKQAIQVPLEGHDAPDMNDILIPTQDVSYDFDEKEINLRDAFLTKEEKILREFKKARKPKSNKSTKKKNKTAKKSRKNNRKRK